MATPSPSPSPPPPAELPSSSSPKKKINPSPWTHQETVNLIQAYQQKWYSLKRGQLKANQWEEVASKVAARCGYDDYTCPAKTVLQCRHKMEKLRKRYREERRRLSVNGNSVWQYYSLMDSLERGPFPVSVQPPSNALIPCEGNGNGENNVDVEEEDEEEEYGYKSRSLSINYILQKPALVNRFAVRCDSRFPRVGDAANKRKMEDVVEKEDEKKSGKRFEFELAGEIRAFSEKMVEVERKKMQMMKETERWRMEMENKRIEMILESQRTILNMINASFGSQEDLKAEQGP